MPLHAPFLRPAEDRRRGQLGAVIADDGVRLAAQPDKRGQLPCHPDARQRRVRHQRQALAREVVDHGEDAEPPAAGRAVRHEVEAPALVRAIGQRHRRPGAQRPLAAAASADLQPFLAV